MIRNLLALGALAFLAACGVDGPPQAPVETAQPGLTVSGDARIGMRGDF